MSDATTKPQTGRKAGPPNAEHPTETLHAAGIFPDDDPPPKQPAQAIPTGRQLPPTANCTPALDDAALYGLAGEIVRTMAPHTEGAPPALLGSLLVFFGSAIGRGAWMTASGCRHSPNLFVCIVGASSRARKTTAVQNVRTLFERAKIELPIKGGVSTGEGIIHAIRDPHLDDEGVSDKRLLIVESELARALASMKRDGSTLSAVLREGWDGSPLGTLTKRESERCAEPHLSLVAAVTAEELLKRLDETELWNGLGNRFLWLLVTRPHLLPDAGELPWRELAPLMDRLTEAVAFARGAGEMQRSHAANDRWREIYAELAATNHGGAVQCLTDRAEAQVLRLAMIYALLDRSRVVEPSHLAAALAFWRFAEASVLGIFGVLSKDARNVLTALGECEMSREEISQNTGRHIYGERLANALAELARNGKATSRRDESTGGRPRELWRTL